MVLFSPGKAGGDKMSALEKAKMSNVDDLFFNN